MDDFGIPTKVTTQPLATNASGASWSVAGPDQDCRYARLNNATGTAIEYRRNGAGNSVKVPDGAVRNVYGVNNLNQIQVHRVDNSNTPVTVDLEACQ
jgi:hypothetical protein